MTVCSPQGKARDTGPIKEVWLISAGLRHKIKQKHDRKFISALKCQSHFYVLI